MRRIAAVTVFLGGLIWPASLPAQDFMTPASRQAIAQMDQTTKQVEKDEAEWLRTATEVTKALESYRPGELHLAPETKVLAALRAYVRKLIEDVKPILDLSTDWSKATVALNESMSKAPEQYRSAAQLFRAWSTEAKYAEFKEYYVLVGDTADGLAVRAEVRLRQFAVDQQHVDILGFLQEGHVFLQRFHETLGAFPELNANVDGQYREVAEKLQKFSGRLFDFKGNLKTFRDKIGAAAATPKPPDVLTSAIFRKSSGAGTAASPAPPPSQQAKMQRVELEFVRDDLAAFRWQHPVTVQEIPFYRGADNPVHVATVKVIARHDDLVVVRRVAGECRVGDCVNYPVSAAPTPANTQPDSKKPATPTEAGPSGMVVAQTTTRNP